MLVRREEHFLHQLLELRRQLRAAEGRQGILRRERLQYQSVITAERADIYDPIVRYFRRGRTVVLVWAQCWKLEPF